MESQIHFIAALSFIDEKLDELHEDFGDLPDMIADKKVIVEKAKSVKEETEGILDELRKFISYAKLKLVENKDKEEALAKKQFMVKNNKEFDAITSEIKHLKNEHDELSTKLRVEGLKEESLRNILIEQAETFENENIELNEMKEEYDGVAEDQEAEVKDYKKKRKKIVPHIKKDFIEEYSRIRETYKDAAVAVKKGSCKGYKVPPQLIVEIRNNLDRIFIDEHSGRILIPEEVYMDKKFIEDFIKAK